MELRLPVIEKMLLAFKTIQLVIQLRYIVIQTMLVEIEIKAIAVEKCSL